MKHEDLVPVILELQQRYGFKKVFEVPEKCPQCCKVLQTFEVFFDTGTTRGTIDVATGDLLEFSESDNAGCPDDGVIAVQCPDCGSELVDYDALDPLAQRPWASQTDVVHALRMADETDGLSLFLIRCFKSYLAARAVGPSHAVLAEIRFKRDMNAGDLDKVHAEALVHNAVFQPEAPARDEYVMYGTSGIEGVK